MRSLIAASVPFSQWLPDEMSGSTSRPKAHDALVRYTFSRPEAMAIELRHVLDPVLHRFIDFDSLAPLPTADSNERLGQRIADLRFSVDVVRGNVRTPLHMALEHQSTLQDLLVCRVLESMSNMWSQWIATHSKQTTVPAILPIVLLQHPARKTPRTLTSRFSLPPTLRQQLGLNVELELLVDDLSGSVLDDALARPGPLALVELTRALLYAYENPSSLTPTRLETLAPLFDQVLDQDPPLGIKDIRALMTYSTKVFKPDSPLGELIAESVSKEGREMYRTIADELRDEGRAEGLDEGEKLGLTKGKKLGRAEGLDEGIGLGRTKGMLEGIELGRTQGVIQSLGQALLDVLRYRAVPVSKDQRKRVLTIRDEQVLKRWFARAFAITSADELFDAG